MRHSFTRSAVVAWLVLFWAWTGLGQSSLFTYQGRLAQNGIPVNGTNDFRIILYNAEYGGSQVGNILWVEDVTVQDGNFTVGLDFGQTVFDGQSRWLEIAVRPGASTGFYTMMSPRQLITSVPYATLAAKSAAVAPGAITAESLATNAITASAISTGAITSGKIAAGAVQAVHLGANAVSSPAIATGAVTADKIAPGAVAAVSLASDTVTTASITNGAVTAEKIAAGAVGATHLASAAITADKLSDGAVTLDKLSDSVKASGMTGVPTGSIMMSSDPNSTNLIASGFTKLSGYTVTPQEWDVLYPENAPGKFYNGYSIVWTGNEAIVWGGNDDGPDKNIGFRYHLASNSWSSTTLTDAPQPRYSHTALWTGSRMIIWGGSGVSPTTNFNTGGRYDPETDQWQPMSTLNAPTPRAGHGVVWTGSEMLIWGGAQYIAGKNTCLRNGGRYNPTNDQWTEISTTNAPIAGDSTFAAWTGTEMLVMVSTNGRAPWGGLYHPASNTWRTINTSNGPVHFGLFIWAGNELFCWDFAINVAKRYSPQTDVWRDIKKPGSSFDWPVWTGQEIIGYNGYGIALFNPATETWNTKYIPGFSESSFWTGSEEIMITPTTVFKYTPKPPLYLYVKP